jgi:hypothetical protein
VVEQGNRRRHPGPPRPGHRADHCADL